MHQTMERGEMEQRGKRKNDQEYMFKNENMTGYVTSIGWGREQEQTVHTGEPSHGCA